MNRPRRRFLFKLALAFGRIDVDAFREEIPNELFAEWMDFYQIDPWDGERLDLIGGILASITAEVWRDKSKHSEPFKPSDFMPDWGATESSETASRRERLNTAADSWVGALKVIREKQQRTNGNDNR